jgi:virulence-associated protein VapD
LVEMAIRTVDAEHVFEFKPGRLYSGKAGCHSARPSLPTSITARGLPFTDSSLSNIRISDLLMKPA